MLDNQAYNKYLLQKSKNQKLIEERMRFFNHFNDIITRNEIKSLSSVSKKDVSDFISAVQWSLVEVQKAFDFLSEYTSFIQKEQPELKALAETINRYCLDRFEAFGKEAVENRKNAIVPIPDDVKIDPKYLGALSNIQFVSAFRELQELIAKMYEDIKKAPFDWGYPDYYSTDGYYNRVIDFVFAFVFCGTYNDGTLTVDMKKFSTFTSIKRHKKPELMIAGFNKTGLSIDGFDKKSASFTVTYAANSNIIAVMNAYVIELNESLLHWSAWEMAKWSLSYRYIEDLSAQKYEPEFLAKMDLSSNKLREIQYWLYDAAEKYSFKIDKSHPYEKNCIQYKKGSKIFLLVGEKDIDGTATIFSKVIFRDIFERETDKVMVLYRKFPDTFKSNCGLCGGIDKKCTMRIFYDIDGKQHRNCAYQSFYFYNPSLDDIKAILHLYIKENKIK